MFYGVLESTTLSALEVSLFCVCVSSYSASQSFSTGSHQKQLMLPSLSLSEARGNTPCLSILASMSNDADIIESLRFAIVNEIAAKHAYTLLLPQAQSTLWCRHPDQIASEIRLQSASASPINPSGGLRSVFQNSSDQGQSQKWDLVNFRGLFHQQTFAKPQCGKPMSGHSTGSTKLDHPHCRQFQVLHGLELGLMCLVFFLFWKSSYVSASRSLELELSKVWPMIWAKHHHLRGIWGLTSAKARDS